MNSAEVTFILRQRKKALFDHRRNVTACLIRRPYLRQVCGDLRILRIERMAENFIDIIDDVYREIVLDLGRNVGKILLS